MFSFPVWEKREKKLKGRLRTVCGTVQRRMPTPFRQKRSSLSVRYANSDLHVDGRTALRNKEALVMIDLADPTMLGILFGMHCDRLSFQSRYLPQISQSHHKISILEIRRLTQQINKMPQNTKHIILVNFLIYFSLYTEHQFCDMFMIILFCFLYINIILL